MKTIGRLAALITFSNYLTPPSGFQRRRLIPVPLPDTSLLEGKVGGQWVDHPPLHSSLKEPFEIKVYEIDDVERLQRREEVGEVSPVRWFG